MKVHFGCMYIYTSSVARTICMTQISECCPQGELRKIHIPGLQLTKKGLKMKAYLKDLKLWPTNDL